MKPAFTCMFALLLWSGLANSAGFDSSFQVHVGYYNADALQDLYVRSPRSAVVPLEDLPIIIPPPVADFILANNGDGTFSRVTQLSGAVRSSARAWPLMDADISARDVDANGLDDLTIDGLQNIISGAMDLIVHAAPGRGDS